MAADESGVAGPFDGRSGGSPVGSSHGPADGLSGRGADPNRRPFALSLCNEVVRNLDFAQQCDLAAALGFDGLEVAPFTLTDDPRKLGDRDLERLRRAAAGAGVRITSLHWLLMAPDGLSITSADARVREETLEVMRALIEACAALGGDVLVHGSPNQRVLSAEDPEGDASRGREAFASIAEVATRAGVTYCIEPLSPQETAFVTNVAEAEAIVRDVGCLALRTMLDARAARLGEREPVETVLRRGLAAGTIAHVHLNDTNRRGPGQGDDPFAGLVEVLLERPYRGIVALEPFEYVPDGPTAAARGIGYVQGLVETLSRGKAGRDLTA